MLVVVSGTHGSGKSTLVADLVRGSNAAVLDDPAEMLDERFVGADASSFVAQLEAAARRLEGLDETGLVVAERGPVDLLAYLDALADLGRPTCSADLRRRLQDLTRESMAHVDLLVVLPLEPGTADVVAADEDLELRVTMDRVLLELVADDHLVGEARVVEIVGDADERLAAVVATINAEAPGP